MFELNQKNYAQVARRAAAEGCVLLKNDEKILPLKKGTKAAVFGIGAFYYYKGGLGSGGLVNTKYVVSILDVFLKSTRSGLKKILLTRETDGEVFHGHKRKCRCQRRL